MFSLPMLLGNVLQTAYSIINAIWVGRILGENDLAAVGVSFPIVMLLIAVANGVTMASSILVAQYAGARNMPQLRRVVDSSTLLIAILAVVVVTVGMLVAGPLLRAMNTDPAVLQIAIQYMQVSLLALPAMFILFLVTSTLRGVGDTMTTLYFQVAGIILTAILDPVLITGAFGHTVWGFHVPALGLNGTAWAQTGVQSLGAIVLLAYLHRKRHTVSPNWRHLTWDWPTSWQTIKIGFPSMIQQALVSLGMLFITSLVNVFGAPAMAAMSAAGRVDMIAFMPAMSMSMAVASLAGQNIGAGKHHRVKEVFWWGQLICVGITVLVSVGVVMYPDVLLRMFAKPGEDLAWIPIGIGYLRIVGAAYFTFAVMFISNGIINGAGHTVFTTIVTLVALWGVRVPLAWYLSQHVMHDVKGVWYGIAFGFATSTVISLAYYFSGRWKKAVVKHGPTMQPETTEETLAPT